MGHGKSVKNDEPKQKETFDLSQGDQRIMFRIRRIFDDVLPVNKAAITQVQDILRSQFPLLTADGIAKIPGQLRNPL